MKTTEEKLDQLIDRLLIKTQDELCPWAIDNDAYNESYTLKLNIAKLRVRHYMDFITFYVIKDDQTIAVIYRNKIDTKSNLVRLFDLIIEYRTKYISEYLDRMISEIETFGDPLPF